MCRIAGIFNASMDIEYQQKLVKQMCLLQQHGGPDDEGVYVSPDQNIVLGNRRLALVDLSAAGHQPMQYENRYWITYNGEIYNFHELRSELISLGHHFNSHTDTEVILAAYSRWGAQSFAKLNGMFAIALWDSEKKELILARDASGMKPLYYSREDKGIAFASEIRALKEIPSLNELNNNWPVYLMAYGHLPEPVTTLKSIYPLPKGCFLKYDTRRLSFQLQQFRHFNYYTKIRDEAEAVDAIRGTLASSVDRHMFADAPIGVFLSGGVDSGILSLLATRKNPKQVNSLSIFFEESKYSEKQYQDILIKQFGCKSNQYLLKESEFHDCFPGILDAMDMPCCDGINTWFISKYAKQQGLKAVLSGIGGDELFGGYPSFNRIGIAMMLRRLPGLTIYAMRRSNHKQLNRISYLNMDGIKGIYLFLRGHFTPHEISKQLDANETEIWNILNDVPVFQDLPNLPLKEKASWMEWNIYMQNQLLRDADVMGMANSVEIRVPFLDNKFIELALSIDPELKYSGNGPKPLLIRSYKSELPEAIWNRPKMGFSFPFASWLSKSEFVKELLEDGNKSTVVNYKKFLNKEMHWSHLMSLIHINNRAYA